MSKQVKSNPHNATTTIKAYILDDEYLRKIGFTDHVPEQWYYWVCMPKAYDISFNVTIPKDGSDIKIEVLDESFLQPYDFQYYLSTNPNHKFALDVQKFVYEQMERLMKYGVISGWRLGYYI